MGVAKHAFLMDYISDKSTYQAVMYACELMKKNGKRFHDAVRIASYVFKVPQETIRHYVSQRSIRARE